jgi:hypothetical protein
MENETVLHSAFAILHSAFAILHSPFCILHSVVQLNPLAQVPTLWSHHN